MNLISTGATTHSVLLTPATIETGFVKLTTLVKSASNAAILVVVPGLRGFSKTKLRRF